MIDVNEVRIGNYLYNGTLFSEEQSRTEVVTVSSISENIGISTREQGNSIISNTDYNPIPLTKWWLQAFEFQEVGLDWRKGDFYIDFMEFGLYTEWVGIPIHLEKVHQLQNLYFSLLGEELTKNQLL